jgi:hypothetical protein
MSAFLPTASDVVEHLDARHEELIRKLDELNARIEQTLAEFVRSRDVSPTPVAVHKAA